VNRDNLGSFDKIFCSQPDQPFSCI